MKLDDLAAMNTAASSGANCIDDVVLRGKVGFGIVGLGLVAQNYLQAFKVSTRGELLAVADICEERVASLTQGSSCAGFADYRRLAENSAIKAVIVCTPPATHEAIATFFLERGINVLCEKPLTATVEQAEQLQRIAQNSLATLSMASKFRHVSDVRKARELIARGTIGEPALYENAFIGDVDMSTRWNVDRVVSGGGVWIDNGTHSVDIMRYLLGPIAAVRLEEGTNSRGLAVEESVHACLRTESGVVGSIDLSWARSNNSESYIRISGSLGVLELGWKQSRWRLYQDSEWTVFGEGYNKVAAFTTQIDDFCDSLRTGKPLCVTMEDMLASMEVVAAGYRSIKSGKWEMVRATTPRLWSEKVVNG